MGYVGNEPDVGFTSFAQQTITGNGGTSYTLSHAVANGKEILLYINNIKQEEGSSKAYTASGTTLTLSEAISSSDSCYCVFLGKALQTTVAPDGSVTSAKLANANLEMPNTLDMNGNELILDADGDTSITADTDDQIDFKIGGTDRAVIDSSGRVLLGTSTAQGNMSLQIEGDGSGSSAQGSIFLRRGLSTSTIGGNVGADLGLIQFGDSDGGIYAKIEAKSHATASTNDYPGRLVFSTTADGASSPTERMRIDSSGNVLIGTTSTVPHNNLGIGLRPDAGILVGVDGTHAAIFSRHNSNGECVRFQKGSTDVGSIDVTGSTTSYNTSSDYRLKENVVTDWDATTRLKQLKPSRFNFIADADTTVDGFLAHEVSSIVPEAISGEKDEVDADGNPEYQGIDQSKLVPLLTKALQEAVAKIETLEAKVTALESK